jgi:hypothetical protein
MEYNAEYWQEMLDEIMDNFDFYRVHKCMVALDWVWGKPGFIPDLSELKKKARTLLKDAIHRGNGSSTGGLKAIIDVPEGVLSLEFIVEQWDAYKEIE